MPAKKRKVNVNGQMVEGTVMPFQVSGGHWNEYLIDDGTVVWIKLVATEVLRVDGHYDQQGNPLYRIAATTVTTEASATSGSAK